MTLNEYHKLGFEHGKKDNWQLSKYWSVAEQNAYTAGFQDARRVPVKLYIPNI